MGGDWAQTGRRLGPHCLRGVIPRQLVPVRRVCDNSSLMMRQLVPNVLYQNWLKTGFRSEIICCCWIRAPLARIIFYIHWLISLAYTWHSILLFSIALAFPHACLRVLIPVCLRVRNSLVYRLVTEHWLSTSLSLPLLPGIKVILYRLLYIINKPS